MPRLLPDDLENSSNPWIIVLVRDNFLGLNSQATGDLRIDMPRSLKLNGKEYVDHEGNIHFDENNQPIPVVGGSHKTVADQSLIKITKNFLAEGAENYFSDAELTAMLDTLFPEKIGDSNSSTLLIANYTQSLLGYAHAAPEAAVNKSSNTNLTLAEKRQIIAGEKIPTTDKANNIYRDTKDKNIYLKSTLSGFDIIDVNTGRRCTIEGVTWLFKLEKAGFKLVSIDVPDDRLKQMYLSLAAPATLDDYSEYSLGHRIGDAFHEIYNPFSNNYNRDAAAFFGYKEAPNDYLQTYETFELVFLPLTLLKNTFKLFTEFFPRMIEKTMEMVVANSRHSIENEYLLGLANLLPTLIYGGAWAFRQIASRLTSPIKSMQDAYAEGASMHPALGVVTAGISAALSLGLMIATGAAGVAILSAAGLGAAVTAAAWIVSHTGPIGTFLAMVAAKATAALGITLTSAPTVIAASTLISTIFAGAMALRAGLQAGLSKLFQRMQDKRVHVSRVAEDKPNEDNDLRSGSTVPRFDFSESSFARIHASMNPANVPQVKDPVEIKEDKEVKPEVNASEAASTLMQSHGGPIPPSSPLSTTATTTSPTMPMTSATPLTSTSQVLFKQPKVQPKAKKIEPKVNLARRKSCPF